MKKIELTYEQALAIKLIGALIISVAIISLVGTFYREIANFFVSFWHWSVANFDYLIYVSVPILIVSIVGSKKSNNFDKLYAGMIVVSIITIVFSTFALTAHFEWLKIYLIILGGLIVVALGWLFIPTMVLFKKTRRNTHIFGAAIAIAYYLDMFIFHYRPTIVWFAIGIAMIWFMSCYVVYLRDNIKEQRRKATLINNIENTNLLNIIIEFIRTYKLPDNELYKQVLSKIIKLHSEGRAVDEKLNLNPNELVSLSRFITTNLYEVKRSLKDFPDLANFLTNYIVNKDYKLIFRTGREIIYKDNKLNLPILFSFMQNKERFIETNLIDNSLVLDFLYNDVKHVYNDEAALNVITILTFAYTKESDSAKVTRILKSIENLIDNLVASYTETEYDTEKNKIKVVLRWVRTLIYEFDVRGMETKIDTKFQMLNIEDVKS